MEDFGMSLYTGLSELLNGRDFSKFSLDCTTSLCFDSVGWSVKPVRSINLNLHPQVSWLWTCASPHPGTAPSKPPCSAQCIFSMLTLHGLPVPIRFYLQLSKVCCKVIAQNRLSDLARYRFLPDPVEEMSSIKDIQCSFEIGINRSFSYKLTVA